MIESFIIHDEYYSDMLCAFVACTIEMQTKRAKGWSLMSDFRNIPLKEFIALSLDIRCSFGIHMAGSPSRCVTIKKQAPWEG